MNSQHLFWTWHDTDPNLTDRLYGVPWTNYFFILTCFAGFYAVFYGVHKLLAPDLQTNQSARYWLRWHLISPQLKTQTLCYPTKPSLCNKKNNKNTFKLETTKTNGPVLNYRQNLYDRFIYYIGVRSKVLLYDQHELTTFKTVSFQ